MYVERIRLNKRVALVIGAGGGGMGTASCMALAEAGATVVALDNRADQLAELEKNISAEKKTCITRVADVMDENDLTAAIDGVIADHGPVHVLVNVVGGMQRDQWGPAAGGSSDQFRRVIDFNLSWVVTACREVGRSMIAQGVDGSIINFASVSGLNAAPWHGAYGAAKAGIIAITRTLAVEWGRHNIRVNAVAPGSFATPRGATVTVQDSTDQAAGRPDTGPQGWFWDNVRSVTPLGRPGRPEDMAGVVLFLASGLAPMITGQTIVVDGGMSARSPIAEASVFEALAAQNNGNTG
jgi:NAD(P)-dependent dehydrogenase (short-subunit alcohol dehydrogenase family)